MITYKQVNEANILANKWARAMEEASAAADTAEKRALRANYVADMTDATREQLIEAREATKEAEKTLKAYWDTRGIWESAVASARRIANEYDEQEA